VLAYRETADDVTDDVTDDADADADAVVEDAKVLILRLVILAGTIFVVPVLIL
jgi:hypothetical protein